MGSALFADRPQGHRARNTAVIRINSQSGKGGVAYILEAEYGFELPRALQIEFSRIVQTVADDEENELSSDQLWHSFSREYLEGNGRFAFISHELGEGIVAHILDAGEPKTVTGGVTDRLMGSWAPCGKQPDWTSTW